MSSKLDLESAVFETQCIANLFQLIASYVKEGVNALDDYTDAIYFVSDMALNNAKRLDEITQHIINKKIRQRLYPLTECSLVYIILFYQAFYLLSFLM